MRHALAAYIAKYRAADNLSDMHGIILLRNKSIAWYEDVLEDGDEVTLLRIFAGG